MADTRQNAVVANLTRYLPQFLGKLYETGLADGTDIRDLSEDTRKNMAMHAGALRNDLNQLLKQLESGKVEESEDMSVELILADADPLDI